MRILEKTPNQLKIKHERNTDRSWIAIPLTILLTISQLFLRESSVTLSCQKNDNKVINCEYQETRMLGLMKMVNFSFEGLKGAKPSPKGSTILLFTSDGRLTTDLGYNSSYEAVSAEIDDFVKNSKKTFLKIHRDNRQFLYGGVLFFLLLTSALLVIILGCFLLTNPILSKIYTFDKKGGKAIFAERKLFGMKVKEYPIKEIVAVRIAGETSPQSSAYKVHLVMDTGKELLLTDFVLVESKNAQKRARNVQETVDTLCSFLNLPDSQKMTNLNEQKRAHNVQEIVDTLCSFLNLPDSQKMTKVNERSPNFIKIQESTPTKLAIAESKDFITMLLLGLVGSPFLILGSFMLFGGITTMLQSSSTEAIVSCDRQKNRCEIRDGYEPEIQHFAASKLQRAQMYMTVGYFAGEVYSLELIASDRGKEEIFSLPIFKPGKTSYQETEEIVKQINAFISRPESPFLKITILQGNPATNFANTGIIIGGIFILIPLGICCLPGMVRVRRTCTFDKNLGKLLLKTIRFPLTKVTEYPLSEIREVRLEQNVGCEVVLVMTSGDRFPIIPSYWYLTKSKAEEIAESIRAFLNLKSLRGL